ncbi:hypothetical protein EV714DRAFT_267819 [Schizophyllum commune]
MAALLKLTATTLPELLALAALRRHIHRPDSRRLRRQPPLVGPPYPREHIRHVILIYLFLRLEDWVRDAAVTVYQP